jgi:hypothetical protein
MARGEAAFGKRERLVGPHFGSLFILQYQAELGLRLPVTGTQPGIGSQRLFQGNVVTQAVS